MSTPTSVQAERVVDGRAVPAPGTWTIDDAHTSVEFVTRHLLSKVRGRFHDFSGSITVGEHLEDSAVNVEIDAASVSTGNAQRDAHLASPDFFDVEQYPHLTFASTAVRAREDGRWELDGDLTIKNVTKPVTLTFDYLGVATDPYGADKAAFSAFTEVDREQWGLNWNAALETGSVLVSKQVRLEFEIQAQRS